MTVVMRREHNVGYVEIDHSPVNAISQSVRRGLLDAVDWAEQQSLERVVVSGKHGLFATGAGISEFDNTLIELDLTDALNAIDESFVPWIAAIDGLALGVGAEIAMACRMRIMAPDARLGFPEVSLGVVPGAGSTQRLPRLVGLGPALDMITSGKALSAQAALQAGLVHALDDEPVEAAFMVNSEELSCRVPARDLPAPEIKVAVVEAVREKVRTKYPGQIAPLRAIDVIESGLALSFVEGLALERRTFLDLRGGDQAKALRHVFCAEWAVKAPAQLVAAAIVPAHAAVVGGGTMGAGIVYALLNAGLRVTLLESDEAGVERAVANVVSIIAASLAAGQIDEQDASECRKRFSSTTDYERVSDATLSIDAASESLAAKREVFAELERVLSAEAILASSCSYLDINQIAATVADPSRVLGLHFVAPAHTMKLFEIVRADQTSERALATGFALAKQLRKVPVLVGVSDGFVFDRMLARYWEAADTVLMDGSTPWEVDEAMVEFGYAMGPYAAQDFTGLDVAHAKRRRQGANRDPARRYIPIGDRMVELGKLGRKTGAGWYRYPGGSGRVDDPIVADLGIEEAHFAGIERVDYSAGEIRERLLLAMINEAADLLQEGVAQHARDIDLVSIFGNGFPRWRGGLMHYADTLGAKSIVAQLEKLAEEDPVAWKISPLLLHCAATTGGRIADAVSR